MVTRIKTASKKMPYTPPIPADLAKVELTENARQVLVRRYVRRGDDGKPAESVIADKAQQKDADAGTKRNYDIEPCRKSYRQCHNYNSGQ